MNVQDHEFTSDKVSEIMEAAKASEKGFVINEAEPPAEDFVNFFFVGIYEGKEVLYDAVLYTLRLHHNSELYELAEHKAAQKFPDFKRIRYEEDENGDLEALDSLEEEIGLYMAEVIVELEDDETVKVQEHVDLDENLDHRIGLDIGLNVDEVTDKTISKFIRSFNNDELELDSTLYSFQTEEEQLED